MHMVRHKTQQLYNALAIRMTVGRWVFVLAWVSYVMNTCISSYLAGAAVRQRWGYMFGSRGTSAPPPLGCPVAEGATCPSTILPAPGQTAPTVHCTHELGHV